MKKYMDNWYYIGGIIFSEFHPLSIFIAYFTLLQFMVRGLVMNRKMGTLYNPGMGTILCCMIPIGIYALWYIAAHYVVPVWNWWVPLLVFPVIAFATIMLPIKLCQDKDTIYVFPKRDTKGFSIKGKVARIRR